jgi:chemotaxis family two-component system sensor kinase Cph1
MNELMQQIGQGDHAALFYRSRQEQFAAVVPYIRIGLERNERCYYIAGDNSVRMVLDTLTAGGIDVESYTKSGALQVATVQESYLKYGPFDPERMIADLKGEVDRALADGYSAFRGSGEMLWAARYPDALSRLLEYEARLDGEFPSKFVALCQYNEPCFEPKMISQLLTMHFKIVARSKVVSNHHYSGTPLYAEASLLTVDEVVARAQHSSGT